MPHSQTVRRLPVGDHVITDIAVQVNIVPIPKHRKHFPGAASGAAVELPAMQELDDLLNPDGELRSLPQSDTEASNGDG